MENLLSVFMFCMNIKGPRWSVDLLLDWLTSASRCSVCSEWRPLLAFRFLQKAYVRQKITLRKKNRSKEDTEHMSAWLAFDLPRSLCLWMNSLDQSHGDARGLDFDRMVPLYGELINQSLFSYSRFLHRLTARGLTFASRNKANAYAQDNESTSDGRVSDSCQLELLRALPSTNPSASSAHQRRQGMKPRFGGHFVSCVIF